MTDWSVSVETALLAPAPDRAVTALRSVFVSGGGAVSVSRARAGVTVVVEAVDGLAAAGEVVARWHRELAAAGVPAGPDVVVEAVTVEERARRARRHG